MHAAHRRKALEPDQLPFGVVSMDGKWFSIPSADDWYAQRQAATEDGPTVGLVRTVTCALTSIPAQPVIDVTSIPAPTNEMGIFEFSLARLCQAYPTRGRVRARLPTTPGLAPKRMPGRCETEAWTTYSAQKGSQPTLLEEAQRWLGARAPSEAHATHETAEPGQLVVRRLYLGEATAAPEGREQLLTVVRVQTETVDCASGKLLSTDQHYFLSSLPRHRLTAAHWLLVIHPTPSLQRPL